ncbi:hypothetical protein CR513_11350, partial [Mucuna pruriens]
MLDHLNRQKQTKNKCLTTIKHNFPKLFFFFTPTIVIPHERHRHNNRHTLDFDVSDHYRRRRSPSYDSYDRHTDCCHRRSKSLEHRNPRHTNETSNDNALLKKFDRKKNGAYLDRDCNNWQRFDSESNKELKGLSYEEYQRLKKQKIRKMLKHYIWNIRLSSLRHDTNDLEDYNKLDEISNQDDVTRKIDKEVEPRRKFEFDSDFEFEKSANRKSSCGSSSSRF